MIRADVDLIVSRENRVDDRGERSRLYECGHKRRTIAKIMARVTIAFYLARVLYRLLTSTIVVTSYRGRTGPMIAVLIRSGEIGDVGYVKLAGRFSNGSRIAANRPNSHLE